MSAPGTPAAGASGPLAGVKIVEFAGLGPVPFAAMLLADLGAEVIRLDRPGHTPNAAYEIYNRGRASVVLDVKTEPGRATALRLIAQADVLIEGYRPGVMERLRLGPEECLSRKPALIYGRITGWGREGELAARAGHDINYLALTGALDSFRRAGETPVPPANLLGDFGGGALYLVTGVLAALAAARDTGIGQVVDAAMVDGVAGLMASICGRLAAGSWSPEPGTNLLDTGAHFYEVYRTSDDRFVAVGAIEPQFYAALLARLGLDSAQLPAQHDRDSWPLMKRRFAELFAQRTRDQWEAAFAGTDACVTPVLSLQEAQQHPHLRGRATYVEAHGVVQPMPAPRFSVTTTALTTPPTDRGEHQEQTLRRWGFSDQEIAELALAAIGP